MRGGGTGRGGQRGKDPGEFNLVHTIAANAQGNIYVGDRNNRRIQVFDGDGTFKHEIKIDVPFDPDAKPAIGNKPDLTNYLQTGGTTLPAVGDQSVVGQRQHLPVVAIRRNRGVKGAEARSEIL